MMKAKTKTYIFMVILIGLLSILPAYNWTTNQKLFDKPTLLEKMTNFYNMDIVESMISYVALRVGISVEPNKTMIGNDGWLFLGNDYANTLNAKRFGITPEVRKSLDELHDATMKWDTYLKNHGVKQFLVMTGPDKDTIYPEKLPKWDKHAETSILKTIIYENKGVYVDTLNRLVDAKKTAKLPLYLHTDTHWNAYGSSFAFDALADAVEDKSIIWPSKYSASDFKASEGRAGDLAAFLRVKDVNETAVHVTDNRVSDTTIMKYDYHTGGLISTEPLTTIGAPESATLVISNNALNDKKVLWIKDSFGEASSPTMLITFKNVLVIHRDMVSPTVFESLVNSFKPDYVFITVVERNSFVGISRVPPNLN
ncbi:alginate O-acetyltransferase AlgX-related protein [Citrobacter werkmanii]|uniref:alginate O-acetyltransferase AlgX-related protein n=1 Tax=Citrobacter werkmanii TaxID=67827 RepID=UPI0034D5C76D